MDPFAMAHAECTVSVGGHRKPGYASESGVCVHGHVCAFVCVFIFTKLW